MAEKQEFKDLVWLKSVEHKLSANQDKIKSLEHISEELKILFHIMEEKNSKLENSINIINENIKKKPIEILIDNYEKKSIDEIKLNLIIQ